MIQVCVERTGTDPVEAKISIKFGPGDGEITEQIVTDVAQATAMTDALENAPGGSLLGVWRGPGVGE